MQFLQSGSAGAPVHSTDDSKQPSAYEFQEEMVYSQLCESLSTILPGDLPVNLTLVSCLF